MAQKSNIPITREGSDLKGREETRSLSKFVRPPIDICETEEGLTLIADIPGTEKEGLSVDIDQGVLTISARTSETRNMQTIFREFEPLNYYRQFQLPSEIDTDKISAELKNGVLTLRLPKAESAKPRRIEITTH